jgi:hypothetical protein
MAASPDSRLKGYVMRSPESGTIAFDEAELESWRQLRENSAYSWTAHNFVYAEIRIKERASILWHSYAGRNWLQIHFPAVCSSSAAAGGQR